MPNNMTTLVQRISNGDADAVSKGEEYLKGTPIPEEEIGVRRALVKYYTFAEGMRREDFGANHLTRDYGAALMHMRALLHSGTHQPQDDLKFYWLLINTGRLKEAQKALESAEKSLQGKPFEFALNVIAALARLYYKIGAFDKAELRYRQLIEQSMRFAGSHLNVKQGRFIGAALARLARIEINRGQPQKAAELMTTFPHTIELDVLQRTQHRAEALMNHGPCSQSSNARTVDTNAMTVVCVKHGAKYGAEYVNRLYSMVRKNLAGDWQFVCITDDATGVRPEVDIIDISRIKLRGWWTKLAMFDTRLPFRYDTVLYLDLDTVVVSPLTCLNNLKVGFYIFEHPDAPSFNSSVMLFDRQVAAPILERLTRQDIARVPGDQEWVEECMPNADTFPQGAIRLYRALEPDISGEEIHNGSAQMVTFPANPKPHQITSGWVKDLWG